MIGLSPVKAAKVMLLGVIYLLKETGCSSSEKASIWFQFGGGDQLHRNTGWGVLGWIVLLQKRTLDICAGAMVNESVGSWN